MHTEISVNGLIIVYSLNTVFAIFAIVLAVGQIVSVDKCCNGVVVNNQETENTRQAIVAIAIIVLVIASILVLVLLFASLFKSGFYSAKSNRITEVNSDFKWNKSWKK